MLGTSGLNPWAPAIFIKSSSPVLPMFRKHKRASQFYAGNSQVYMPVNLEKP